MKRGKDRGEQGREKRGNWEKGKIKGKQRNLDRRKTGSRLM